MRSILFHALNGAALGSVLFLLASGLTVVFGLMRVLNLAHGAFFLLGGYVGHSVQATTGSFLLAALAATATTAALGLAMQRSFLTTLEGSIFNQVLLTLGIAFVMSNAIQLIWGAIPRSISAPELLRGSTSLFGFAVPIYRLFLIVLALISGVLVWSLWERSRYGAIVRACVDDRAIAAANGINVRYVFGSVFTLGSGLAGLAGVLAGPILGVQIGLEFQSLLLAVVVVVVGGIGSLFGAFVGSMLIGMLDSFGRGFIPEIAVFTLFAPVVLILLLRPRGLFGKDIQP